MEDYISISQLNDFIFCPYSIYLHSVYMEADEDRYHATPQVRGRQSHESVDRKSDAHRHILQSLPVYSESLGLMGKIDQFDTSSQRLIERKYELKQLFRGQQYQLWAQYLCMLEMGYLVSEIAFYEISTRRMMLQPLPTILEIVELTDFIERFRGFDPNTKITINPNKCRHCIYCNLCHNTDVENVYE